MVPKKKFQIFFLLMMYQSPLMGLWMMKKTSWWSITTRTIYYFENTYKLLINDQKIGNFLHFFFSKSSKSYTMIIIGFVHVLMIPKHILKHFMTYFCSYSDSGQVGPENNHVFFAISPTLGSPSVAQCCLNVDLYPSYDKNTSMLTIAPSPMSKKFLERFLAKKTSFFVFFKSQARFVAKWLMYPCWPPRGGSHVLTSQGGSTNSKSTHLQDSETLSAHKMAFHLIWLL